MENWNINETVSRLADDNQLLRQRIQELEPQLQQAQQKQNRISKEEAKLLREIQKCKIELKKQDIKKTGYNKHNKYSYFELDDFLSCVEIILNKRGLASYFHFEDEIATLTICNEDGVCHKWITRCTPAKVKENGYDVGVYMKSEQAVQTYARRTLWLQAMEITEPNAIESDGKTVQKKQDTTKKVQRKRADEIIQPVVQEKEKEVSATRIQDILREAHNRFEESQENKKEKDKKPFNWDNAKRIIKMLCENENEYEICKQSTIFKTADQV